MTRHSKPLEIYLHIPFCEKKCRYCDFLSAPADEETKRAYTDALIREMKSKSESLSDHEVVSLFFGGGTPSALPEGEIVRIMESLRKTFFITEDAEITLESNPGTLTREKLSAYRSCGINRLSIGVQSASDRELEMLGRIHKYADVLESYDYARKEGFQNINFDLISGLPGQKTEDYLRNIRTILRLRPEHISVYSLMIEEGTDFFGLYGEDEKTRRQGGTPMLLPTEEAEREMYHRTKEILEKSGYLRYEISNYAKNGFECRHNLGYWRRTEYLGLGLGAASLLSDTRFSNTRELQEYLEFDFSPRNEDKLSKKNCMEEFMFLGLRETGGVSKAEFYRQFGIPIRNAYGNVIDEMVSKGLLAETETNMLLTGNGIDVSNVVMSSFLLD